MTKFSEATPNPNKPSLSQQLDQKKLELSEIEKRIREIAGPKDRKEGEVTRKASRQELDLLNTLLLDRKKMEEEIRKLQDELEKKSTDQNFNG